MAQTAPVRITGSLLTSDKASVTRVAKAQAPPSVPDAPASEVLATPSSPLDLKTAQLWFESHQVTFGVSVGKEINQRAIPFDPLPRRMLTSEWSRISAGLKQRVQALDEFVRDIFGEQLILRSGRVPSDVIYSSPSFIRAAAGPTTTRPGQVCVAGIDLVNVEGRWLVLEDNLRVPSGASYSLAARRASADLMPSDVGAARPLSLGTYPKRLLAQLHERAVNGGEIVLLSPGEHNPAHYEHRELARLMGIEMVEGHDLIASQRGCWRLTGAERVPVGAIYHRFSPEYLDPVCGPQSVIGVPFLLAAWRSGALGLANTPACGVADDKAIFPYVPDIIRYYLAEQPILEQPPTLDLCDRSQRKHAFDRFTAHVFKPIGSSGGKGIVFGPCAREEDRESLKEMVAADPRAYIAQPALDLEQLPCLRPDGAVEMRRCDLRSFVLQGEDQWVMPGGLTRVAATADEWLVNSSAGGGIKDTWVLPL